MRQPTKKCYDCNHCEMCAWLKEVEEQGCEFFDNGNKWIPCSERLPLPDENPVIVSWMGIVNIGWFSCGRWETGTRLPMDGVEAWMPLPNPYKEVE